MCCCIATGSVSRLYVYRERLGGGGEGGAALYSPPACREVESQEDCHED